MSKRRIVRNSIFNENVVDTNFDNQPSSTLFRLGSFTLDTNLENRVIGDFSNKLSIFSKEYTLESIGLNKNSSEEIYKSNNKLNLNLDYKNITSYTRYGSLEDLFKYSIKNIIKNYPYSLFMNNQLNTGIANTVLAFSYDEINDTSTFNIPTITIINISNIFVNSNNNIPNEDNPLKNFNLTKEKYVVWDSTNPDKEYPIIGFNGNLEFDNIITLTVRGKLFNLTNSNISKKYHIKPSKEEFNKFLFNLNDIEKYFLSKKTENGYSIGLKVLNSDNIGFTNKNVLWPVNDGYNVNLDGASYISFLSEVTNIGKSYDEYKTDIIYRLYTTKSLKEFDTTNDGKMSKLIRTYGYEFDKIRRLVDGFATLNNLTYNKQNSVPDILVKNLAKVLGWNIFDIIKEDDLLNNIFTVNSNNNASDSLIPSEIDIELWKRILLNTKWFFKSKGTRKSLETIFKLIGIPEQFIQLNEYIYLAENKLEIEDRKISTTQSDIFDDLIITNPSSVNDEGYPISVPESSNFFFQVSGNTDSGQKYLDRFRENGFIINDFIDNKKSWSLNDSLNTRVDENTIYKISDTKLLINTKEIDIGLNPSNALEYDIFNFNKSNNFPICSTGSTYNVLYINNALSYENNQQTVFEIPDIPEGDIQVNINGITLLIDEEYTISGQNNNIITLLQGGVNILNNIKDIISITYLSDPIDKTRNLVEYVITNITVTENGQFSITLPETPNGDIQLVLNGLTLTNGRNSFDGDFYINPNNANEIIISSDTLITTDKISIMYVKELQDENIKKYSDTHKVTSFFSDKLYFNNIINRYIFISDYSIIDQNIVKVIVNGITLTNGVDFTINQNNKKQIIFSPNVVIKINDNINVFYVIEDGVNNNCIYVDQDINNISFLDYLQIITKDFINVKNRKIITDNNGGIYPKISLIYDLYNKASNNLGNPKSNGYTFNSLYNYIKNFDGYFTKFVDQLLPATTIVRKGGLIVSNSVFGNQKYKYIRGINDGSEFVSETQKLTCDLLDFTTVKTPATTSENLGSLTINATGFNNFVEYSIDGGEFYFIDNTFTDLQPGNYNISLKDDIGCIITGSTEIEIDCNLFSLEDIIVTNQTSDSSLGSIEIIATGDTNIRYSIDGGLNFKLNDNIFNNLNVGNYDIVIKNSLDCIVTGSTQIEIDCNVSITEFEYGSCNASGFVDRIGSSLSVVNNNLALNLVYNFTTDNQFSRFFREKVVITETTTSHILLEKWVEFEVEPGVNSVNLGNVFIYTVPTYQNFEFTNTFSNQSISCTPFTTPLPNDVFTPLPDEPEITYELTAVDFGEVFITGGNYDISLGAQINNTLSQNITVNVNLPYNDGGTEGIITESIFINQGEFNGVINTTYTSSTGVDNTTFGTICIDSINYTGPETIVLINPCEI